MESYLDEAISTIKNFKAVLEEYRRVQKKIQELNSYYGNQDWFQDLDDDKAGRLPKDLKRGVLSQDAVYDLLTENRSLLLHVMEVATETIRNN